MLRRFLHSKIRDLRVTGTHLDYEGSIELDANYIKKAGLHPNEEVQILNVENGERFLTYILEGKPGSEKADLNGPAARKAMRGDRIMVLAYCYLTPEEISGHKPIIVSLGK